MNGCAVENGSVLQSFVSKGIPFFKSFYIYSEFEFTLEILCTIFWSHILYANTLSESKSTGRPPLIGRVDKRDVEVV